MAVRPEDYLDKKVRQIFEPMVSALLVDRPQEPVIIKKNNIKLNKSRSYL